MKKCKRCNKNRAVINFCNDYAKEINRAHENVLERTRAAVCYLNMRKPAYNGFNDDRQKRFKQEETFAFLQIFHPEISEDRAMQLAQGEAK